MMLLDTEDDNALWFDHGIIPDFLVGFFYFNRLLDEC